MIFYWTKSNKVGSRLIRWGLGEDCSHFAVSFGKDDASAIVVHSTMEMGVHPVWHQDFIDTHEIVHKLFFGLDTEVEVALYREVVAAVIGKEYDSRAILYWSWIGFKAKAFGAKIPGENSFADQSAYYCTEVLNALRPFLLERHKIELPELDDQILSPHGAWSKLSAICG